MNKEKDVYNNLVSFWNQNFIISEEEKNRLLTEINPNEDYKDLAPSKKQYDALTLFRNCERVLDYGCGSGWASIIMAKNGAKKIDAVDVAPNSIAMVDLYKQAFNLGKEINAYRIDSDYLKTIDDNVYDGFFSSNVVDVIPLDMAKEIIKESARITKTGAVVVYSFNYYIEPSIMKERGFDIDGPHIYINGVLRLTALKDEEWLSLFSKYFKDVKLSYFAWAKEENERRRLFIMKK